MSVRERVMRKESPEVGRSAGDAVKSDRREALKTLGRFAIYVSPAMSVLLPGSTDAHHQPGHTVNCKNFPGSPYCSQL